MNSSEQKRMLKKASDALGAALKRKFAESLEFKPVQEPERSGYGIDCYVISLASIPRIDPDLNIDVCLETSRSDELWFWAGFSSPFRQPIRKLRELCPSKLAIIDVTRGYEKDKIYYYFNQTILGALRTSRVTVEYHNLISALGTYSRHKERFSLKDSEYFISTILSCLPELDPVAVTRRALMDARVGQGKFRKQVSRLWGEECAVIGVDTDELLRASHIKPWQDSLKREKVDPCNGILLCTHLDALFDKFLISFKNDGAMLVSDKVGDQTKKLLRLEGMKLRQPLPLLSRPYLEYHRQKFEERRSATARNGGGRLGQ